MESVSLSGPGLVPLLIECRDLLSSLKIKQINTATIEMSIQVALLQGKEILLFKYIRVRLSVVVFASRRGVSLKAIY